MMYAVEMASCGMIYIRSFVKTDTSIQAILRFNLSNLRDRLAFLMGGIYELRR
jgi:hypothetical protein